MYYSDFERITRMERMLEKLAYFSIALDFMVAVATLFVLRGAQFSSFMLQLSNYLLAIEVVIALVVFVALVALKHYKKIIERVALATFRNKYKPVNVKFRNMFGARREPVANY